MEWSTLFPGPQLPIVLVLSCGDFSGLTSNNLPNFRYGIHEVPSQEKIRGGRRPRGCREAFEDADQSVQGRSSAWEGNMFTHSFAQGANRSPRTSGLEPCDHSRRDHKLLPSITYQQWPGVTKTPTATIPLTPLALPVATSSGHTLPATSRSVHCRPRFGLVLLQVFANRTLHMALSLEAPT